MADRVSTLLSRRAGPDRGDSAGHRPGVSAAADRAEVRRQVQACSAPRPRIFSWSVRTARPSGMPTRFAPLPPPRRCRGGWCCCSARPPAIRWRRSPPASNIADRVIWLPGVGRADLVTLLQGAGALLQPSLYEGFGLPVRRGDGLRMSGDRQRPGDAARGGRAAPRSAFRPATSRRWRRRSQLVVRLRRPALRAVGARAGAGGAFLVGPLRPRHPGGLPRCRGRRRSPRRFR